VKREMGGVEKGWLILTAHSTETQLKPPKPEPWIRGTKDKVLNKVWTGLELDPVL
jgi:hypothetical protein